MNQFRIFLAAPISGCANEAEYQSVKDSVLTLIRALRSEGYVVSSELEDISGNDSYDSPGSSVIKDFGQILMSDVFLWFHPRKMQTSALIELGYAYAHDKNIIMVSPMEALPYMALGLPEVKPNVHIVEAASIDEKTISQIVDCLRKTQM